MPKRSITPRIVSATLFLAALVSAQNIPTDTSIDLQKRGIGRLERYRTEARRQGSSDRSQLELAGQELDSSSTALEREGLWKEAARSTYEDARCYRILGSQTALPHYKRARELAQKAGDRDLEAKAVYGLAFIAGL